MQRKNIYLWVASDRCWGEDSRILQFDEGNNLKRLMRNILPNSCLPCATATRPQSCSTHQLLLPKRTKFPEVQCPEGWRCPALVFSTQNGDRQLGTARGLWVLAPEPVKVRFQRGSVTPRWWKWGDTVWRSPVRACVPVPAPSSRMGSATGTIAPRLASTAVPSSWDGLQSPWGERGENSAADPAR